MEAGRRVTDLNPSPFRVEKRATPTMRAMATTEDRDTAGSVGAWRGEPGAPERTDELFSTISGVENEPLYARERGRRLRPRPGLPGRGALHRGVYPSMYRGRLWTMRQFAGFGTAEETARFRYLRDHGQTGLSTAFDMPTLMGYDSDHARALGEVGREAWRSTPSPTWRRSSPASRSATSRPR